MNYFRMDDPGLEDEDIGTAAQVVRNARELVAIREADRLEALAYLYNCTVGKKIDKNYQAYCGALMREYFNERQIVDHRVRRQYLEEIIAEHTEERLKEKTVFTANVIERSRDYNEEISGINVKYVWYWPFPIKVALDDSNQDFHKRDCINWRAIGIGTTLLVGGTLFARYAISRAFSKVTDGITIQFQALPLALPSTIDTVSNHSQNIIQSTSPMPTDTSIASSVSQIAGHVCNIAKVCLHQAQEGITWMSLKISSALEK